MDEQEVRTAMADWLSAAMFGGREVKRLARSRVRQALRQHGGTPCLVARAPLEQASEDDSDR